MSQAVPSSSPLSTAPADLSSPSYNGGTPPELSTIPSADHIDPDEEVPGASDAVSAYVSPAMSIAPARSTSSSPKRKAADVEVDHEGPKKKKPRRAPVKKIQPIPVPSTRPSRSRKAPQRFEDLAPLPTPKSTTKKGVSKVFNPDFITTNANSRLAKDRTDVYHMLLEKPAWATLAVEQQIKVVSMLPKTSSNQDVLNLLKAGNNDGPKPGAFTLSNTCFRTDVAKFKEDLSSGHLGKTWQANAMQAMTERLSGKYDDWKAAEAERWWGQNDEV